MHRQSKFRSQTLMTVVGLCWSLALTGCDLPFAEKKLELTPVSGKVTLDGEPVVGAKVVFLPRKLFVEQSLPHPPAAGITDDKGIYYLQTDKSDGAPAGEYLVLISKRDDESAAEAAELSMYELARNLDELNGEAPLESWMSAETISAFYNRETSLRFTVPQKGSNQADFQLSIFELPLDRGKR
ncbi:MAG: hypothetical protein ACKO81_11450 [Planctomycetota bacterium]